MHIMYILINKVFKRSNTVFVTILLLGVYSNVILGQPANWVVPKSAENIVNPFQMNNQMIEDGEKIYTQYCAICHGKKGKGDGIAGMSLNPKPANFTKKAFQIQSDGTIFWKLSEGRAPMAPYKDLLTEKERWEVINYIRSLTKK